MVVALPTVSIPTMFTELVDALYLIPGSTLYVCPVPAAVLIASSTKVI